MQLGIISSHPVPAPGKGGGHVIAIDLVAYPATAFRNDGKNSGAVTIIWRDMGEDYSAPVVAARPSASESELLESSAIMTAIANLSKKHGKKALCHPANLIDLLQKQNCRHVVLHADGTMSRIRARATGEEMYGASIGKAKVSVSACSVKAAQSAINRELIGQIRDAKGKDKAALATALTDWLVNDMPVKALDDVVHGKDVAPLSVYWHKNVRNAAAAEQKK